MSDELFWRRALVVASALIYWVGVLAQARRVRRHIGRSPNLRPRGPKERLLWAGWLLVILVWVGQPFVLGVSAMPRWLQIVPPLVHPLGFAVGTLLLVAGYAGTLWCYASMGDAWRIGINRDEKNLLVTEGPYRAVRHPIYLYQIVMLAGAALLLPTLLSAGILFLHLLCVRSKAADEEFYLQGLHGPGYRDYMSRTGRLFPRWTGN